MAVCIIVDTCGILYCCAIYAPATTPSVNEINLDIFIINNIFLFKNEPVLNKDKMSLDRYKSFAIISSISLTIGFLSGFLVKGLLSKKQDTHIYIYKVKVDDKPTHVDTQTDPRILDYSPSPSPVLCPLDSGFSQDLGSGNSDLLTTSKSDS